MTWIPDSLIKSLRQVESFNEDSFIRVHQTGEQITSIRVNPFKQHDTQKFAITNFKSAIKIPWTSTGFYLSERPSFTLDPFFHAGYYYVQEASGMFLEEAIRQTVDLSKPLKVLDLCAAPGGKSTLIQSIISKDSLLISNEVIRSRVSILEENMTRWGAANLVITNNDPKDFSSLSGYFDLIVIDAPCSGSGLFRRDPEAVEHWSELNVQLCQQRQERILADIFHVLKPGGILIYSTCSYSKEENEDILDKLLDQFRIENLKLDIESYPGINETVSDRHAAFGYRFWPDRLKGEGFFISCFRKKGGDESTPRNLKKTGWEKLTRNEESIVQDWLMDSSAFVFFRYGDQILGIPSGIHSLIQPLLASNLYIRQAGLRMGKFAGKELIPDPALALSPSISKRIVAIPLKQDQALQYLRREEVSIESDYRGWAVVEYEGANLGWVKKLQNRINNYYPKEWRIRMK